MFGDVPDTTVTIVRVGPGTAIGRAREEGHGMTRELRLDLAVGSGLCRRSRAERREEREARRLFSETENVRRVPGYNAAIVLTVGLSNELRMR